MLGVLFATKACLHGRELCRAIELVRGDSELCVELHRRLVHWLPPRLRLSVTISELFKLFLARDNSRHASLAAAYTQQLGDP